MASECLGLDIGSSAIKAIVLRSHRKGRELIHYGIEPLPPQTIVDGAIMDQSAVIEAIGRLRTALGFRAKDVATAIAGHSVIVKKIELPPMAADELAEQIPIEAEQHIPFRRDIDHQVGTARNAHGQMEVVLVAAKKEMIADHVQVIREAKLQPVVVDVAAFCVQNAFEAAYGDRAATETVALVHTGNAITHVNVLVGGVSVFTRDVTVGGATFTEEIQRKLHVSHDDAEAFKLALGEPASAGGPPVPGIVSPLVDEIADATAAKLQRTIDFFLASAHDIKLSRIFLSGGSAKVAALARCLGERAKVPVELLDPFKRTTIDPKKLDVAFVRAHAPEAVVAFGLALRHAGESRS